MKTLFINGVEYKYNCVYAEKRGINGNIGINIQLQVFKNGVQLDKKDFFGYIEECICRHIRDELN